MTLTKLFSLLIAFACVSQLQPCLAATDQAKLADEVKSAVASFERTDTEMKKLFSDSAGYVVFPNVGKGGFVFGGAHGEGLVFEKGKLIGRADLTQVTVGAQIGGQVFSEVIFFETKDTLENFKKSNAEMSAQVSATAAAEGASKNARYIEGVMVFTKPKTGLMVEASVGGQKFQYTPIQGKANP